MNRRHVLKTSLATTTLAGNRVAFEDREQAGAHDFGFSADTSHAGGRPGEIGGESVALALKPGRKAEGASFDRFGFFSVYPGGQRVKIFFNDLEYTVSRRD
jgi:hypothetical protein